MHRNPLSLALSSVLGLSLFASSTALATINPLPLTPASYNADVVVEKTATPVLKVVTTASVDQGTNNGANTWMEIGFDPANPSYGLPNPGTVIVALSNANYSFQMPSDYTLPNGILIDTLVTNGNLRLTTPATYTLLSFLGSGGNGGDVVGVRISHADGTVQTGPTFSCPDWFNGTVNVAYIANERCASTVNFTYGNIGSGNPRLYFRDVTVTNTVSAITNIELFYSSGPAGSHNDILAVSGATTVGGAVAPVAVTGWTYDFIVEKEAAKRGRVITSTVIDGTNVWATSQSMDNIANTGNAWYEKGFNVNNPDGGGVPIPDASMSTVSGLPAAGSFITNAAGDHIYKLAADYTANNAVWVAIPPAISNAVMTLQTPTAVSVLSLLASAGNGPVNNILVVTTHADSTTETNVVNVANWFDGNPYVYGANGRVAVDTAQFNNVRNTAVNPRLYPVDFLVNPASPVVSVEVINTNLTGGRIAVFAISGTLDPVLASFSSSPGNVVVNSGANANFSATAVANVPITYGWQKGTNGVYVNLSDGGNISGATTTTLTVSTVDVPDEADYRLSATDAAGTSYSAPGTLIIISPLQDVTQPTDVITAYQPSGGSSPAAETVDHAIDNGTQKYLNNGNGATPMAIPVGFTVTPATGRTRVTGMRLYTANDVFERDPANIILQGSDDGGATWSLIYSNLVTLPAGRNAAGAAIDPFTHFMTQVRFSNANGYSMYRWFTTRVRGNVNLMQIGEVELLGVADTSGKPAFNTQPASIVVRDGEPANLSAVVDGVPTPGVYWLRRTTGAFGNVTGANVSGATTVNLSINPAHFADAAEFICIATNTSGATTSQVARLSIISPLNDVTSPSDPIIDFGDESGGTGGVTPIPFTAIDDSSTLKFQTIGGGPNGSAGFPPFEGPVGVVVTPAVGSTLVTGLRLYTADANEERDPADYVLEGSNNNGTNYAVISAGALALPSARSSTILPFDATQQPMQEVLFANHTAYTTYRLTINHVKGPANNANSMQFGEMELLGLAAPGGNPTVTVSAGAGGSLNIVSTQSGTLLSTTSLALPIVWTDEGPITANTPRNIIPAPGQPQKYYIVSVRLQ